MEEAGEVSCWVVCHGRDRKGQAEEDGLVEFGVLGSGGGVDAVA